MNEVKYSAIRRETTKLTCLSGEYAPVVVEFDEEGRESGIIRFTG